MAGDAETLFISQFLGDFDKNSTIFSDYAKIHTIYAWFRIIAAQSNEIHLLFSLFMLNFPKTLKEGLILRITIDTEANYVIVPNTFFDQIDKMNAIIEENGGKKLDYTQYVKDAFAKAVSAPLKRQADVVKPRKAPSSKDKK